MNKRFYFIGIKGSGMSALACILKDLNLNVTGSDIEKYVFTQEHLLEHNISFFESFDADHINNDDFVIVGNAFDESNVEVKHVMENNIKHMRYPQFLKELMQNYASCCVVGTHGKTNTTGLLSHVLNEHEPCGYLIGDGSGYMPENSEFFVLEACEYKRNFLNYYPDYAILLNIELDHVDYYKDMDDYLSAFQSFTENVKKGIAVYGDQKETHQLTIENKKVLYYGFDKSNDVYADNIVNVSNGVEFDCYYNQKLFGHFFLPMFGKHLLCNALGVIAVSIMNQVDAKTINDAFATYKGTDRRFVIEDFSDYVYIDDYAHHPTAIEACIKTAKDKYPDKKVIAIFKPDRFSRIEYFLDRFNDAFKEADETYICDFPSNAKREEGITVTIDDLIDSVDNAKLLSEDEKGVNELGKYDNCVYLFMSSKDIYKLKDKLKAKQQEGK